MNPKIAVISDAGRATRFLPATKVGAKTLIPVGPKPILLWLLQEIMESGVKDVVIVANRYNLSYLSRFIEYDKDLINYLREKKKEYLLDEYFEVISNLNIEIVVQPRSIGYGNAAPVIASSLLIGSSDFIYMYGDDLVFSKKKGFLTQMLDVIERYPRASAALGVQAIDREEVYKYGIVKNKKQLEENVYLMDYVVEKPSVEEAPSNLVSFGRYIFKNEIVEILKERAVEYNKNKTKNGQEFQIQPAINELQKLGDALVIEGVDTKWVTTGDPKNMFLAWKAWNEFVEQN